MDGIKITFDTAHRCTSYQKGVWMVSQCWCGYERWVNLLTGKPRLINEGNGENHSGSYSVDIKDSI